MNEQFNENHLSALYKFLGHQGFVSRVGSLDYSTQKYEQVFLKSEKEVLAYARTWNGKRNIFIGRARRDSDGNPTSCRVISFDIDPIRDKGVAASDIQHTNALDAAKRLISLYPGGYVSSSGNGALLIYFVDDFLDRAGPTYYAKEAVLIKELQEKVNDLNVKIDHTSYSEAVIKAIGTFSTKGELSLRRCSRWITYPLPPYSNCKKLLARLSEIEPQKSLSQQSIDVQQLRSSFNGDRSIADYHLVSFLKRSGVEPSDALAALQANPLGRQGERPDDQARLISKIYGNNLDVGGNRESSYFEELFLPKREEGNVRSGISALDKAIRSFPKGEITTVAARSGFGKSSFACTVGELLRKGHTGNPKRVLYFSTEMQREYIMHKLVSIACNISLQTFIEGSFSSEEQNSIKTYRKEFESNPLIICDEFQPTIELVRNKVLQHKPDLIIFDHISHVATHWEGVAQFTRTLKELTAQEGCCTLMLSMLNEPPRDKSGGVMQSVRGDVRGSQELIFLSAIYMLINNVYEVKSDIQPVRVDIAKNRYGISGVSVELNVNKLTGRFFCSEHNPL